jgi:D-arabinose 1-dehydrogenase-like Zn-dependent alcohol dehydrogenase
MMPDAMQAAVLEHYEDDLALREVARPRPREDEVLVRVRAAGLCGTDLKLIDGLLAPTVALPVIPGHEIAGELVDDTHDLQRGQRVAAYLYDSCGKCARCTEGRPTICTRAARLGIERDGGLAEYVAVPRANALPFSKQVGFERAAVAMDAVAAPWSALHGAGRVQRDQRVLVVGVGGLGTNAVQVARSAGARVAAVDPAPGPRNLAVGLGAEIAADPDEIQPILDWSGEGVDLSIEMSGARQGFEVAARLVRAGGRIVCCGYAPGVEYGVDSARLVLSEVSVIGSRSATLSEARDALAAVNRGEIVPAVGVTVPLVDVNRGLERLRAGDAGGRVVVEV